MLTEPARPGSRAKPDAECLAGVELTLGGMHCSACATRIQKSLNRLPTVASASVNLVTERAFISYNPEQVTAEQLCQAVVDIGYWASAVDDDNLRSGRTAPSTWGS